jgi:DinB superfamily
MRTLVSLLLVTLMSVVLFAQSKNSTTDAARKMVAGRAKNMVAAAEEMPADKYSFKPTPAQETFAHMQVHIVEANNNLCSAVGGTASAEDKDLKDTDPKDKIVAAMRRSFDTCTKALANLTDAQLGDDATVFGQKASKGTALLVMASGWGDHYASQAMYLRLNGHLPPTAKKPADTKAATKDEYKKD